MDASLSADIEQLTAELRDAGQQRGTDTGAASYQHLSSQLIRSSLSVLKLEKQTRLQKVGIRMLLVCVHTFLSER